MLDIQPYSSNVKLTLSVAGLELNVAQLGSDFLILRDKVTISATDAMLTIAIDGRVRTKRIILSQGIAADVERTFFW